MMKKLKKHVTCGLSMVLSFQFWVIVSLCGMVMDAKAAESGPIPAAYWKLDETGGLTAFDASGNNQNGTLVNHAAWSDGISYGALAFDGMDDRMDLGTADFKIAQEFSAAAWVHMAGPNINRSYQIIVQTGRYVNPFMLRMNGQRIQTCIRTTAGTRYFTSTGSFQYGQWYHVALTYRDNEQVLYINGQEDSRNTITEPLATPTNDASAVGSSPTGSSPFNGMIDEVVIYNQALTSFDIANVMAGMIQTRPAAPMGLMATSVSFNQIDLQWQAPAIPVSGYRIYRDGSLAGSSEEALYSDTGLNPATRYTYTVRAVDGNGNESSDSAPAIAVTPAIDLSAGLVAHWELDEENGDMAPDASGLGNAAALVNGPVWDSGKVGGSLRFDGVNDYLDAGNNAFGLTGEVTTALWVKPAVLTSNGCQVLIQRGRYVYPLMMRIDSKRVRACIRTSSGTHYLTGQSVLVPDQWYHVAMTFKSGEIILYIDGKEESRAAADGQMSITANQKTTLGANPLGQTPFAGNLDDVRIYDSALSPAEIMLLTRAVPDNPPPQNLSDRDAVLALITGNSFYLDAEYGDDATGQGTSALPWKTLAKAQSVVRSGDGVFLRNGNYGAYVENTTGRTAWVVYINDEGHAPVITNVTSRFNSKRNVYLAFYGIKIAPVWVDPAGNETWQATHPGSADPQYAQSALGTYMKTASPVNALYSDHLMFINCEMEGTNKHLTAYGLNLSYCSDVLIKGCHIQRIVRGIVYQNGTHIKVLYNHIHNITSTFIGSGAYCSDVLIEGNNCYDSNWSKTEDWCPRALNQNYHASFISIRSSDVTIRKNIFHDGGTSSTFMLYDDPNCPESYHNILIENNLVYDPQNQTGLRLYRVGSNIVVRNNILVGRERYDAQPGPLQYSTAFSLSGVAAGYDGSGLSVYNNIFVGMAGFGAWFGNVQQGGNIFWSALTTPGGVWSFLTQADLANGSKMITSRNGIAPDYFTNGFFNGEMDFSWSSEVTDVAIPHGHGNIIDYTYAPSSEAINFGDVTHQPADSLGTLDASGFIINNGQVRSDSRHSTGCYEP